MPVPRGPCPGADEGRAETGSLARLPDSFVNARAEPCVGTKKKAGLHRAGPPPGMIRRPAAALAAAVAMLALAGAGCSGQNTAPAKPAAESGPAGPAASIEIDYASKRDTLKALTVTQFTGATVLLTRRATAGRQSSVVRFDGGVPMWRFHSERGLLNPLSVLDSGRYHVGRVSYGEVPPGFAQDIPDSGPPAPLEADNYYVFTIERASGAVSYQAVRVNEDGSLEAYDAEPRAGTSYSLCCNVRPGFIGRKTFPDYPP